MKNVTLLRDFSEDNRTSMNIYADQLAVHLQAVKGNPFRITEFTPKLSGRTHWIPGKGNLRMRYARYFDYPNQVKKLNGDLFHILDHGYAHLMGKLNPSRVIITVHDLIPLLAGRGLIPGVKLKRRNWLSEYSVRYLKKARKIITVSQNTRDDLVNYAGCDPESIKTIYSGLDTVFQPASASRRKEYRAELGLPDSDTKLVLITGQDYYKNQETSLRVMEQLQKKYNSRIRLVCLGRQTAEWQGTLKKSSFKDQVIHFHFLPHEKVSHLYNSVNCLLFPSWYEGFGWPPAEAMACGIPVVTSNAASLPEVVGKEGLTFEPGNVEGMVNAVERLFEDKSFREYQIARGLENVKRFDWNKNSASVLEVYKEIAAD
jgi:glycosyltransferase involved in cell wall biosynthesis